MRAAPYDVYVRYLALKRHFTSSYDFFKYNGKVKSNYDAFTKRRDQYLFAKVAKDRNWENLLLANLVEDPSTWIGDIAGSDEAKRVYLDWARRNESITYTFTSDLAKMADDLRDEMRVVNGQHPKLLTRLLDESITLETASILLRLSGCEQYWSANVVDPVLFPAILARLQKYHPFIVYDRVKLHHIIMDKVSGFTAA